jgi:hypothetical protein
MDASLSTSSQPGTFLLWAVRTIETALGGVGALVRVEGIAIYRFENVRIAVMG